MPKPEVFQMSDYSSVPVRPSDELHPIAELIWSRLRSGSKPMHRTDGRRIALAIEGGGMRGVVSAGMVAALEQLKMLDAIDVVYGSSAGALSGAYFIAGQARYGTTIFYENINNREFIDLWRLLAGKPVLSLEFLLDHVCIHEKPLDIERVLRSPIPLNVVSSSLSAKKSVPLSGFANREELFQAIRGSARIPYFAGDPVQFRGDKYLDASVYESIPFRMALDEHATDIIVLLTRPAGELRTKPGWIDRYIVAPYLRKLDSDFSRHYLEKADEYHREMIEINSYLSGRDGIFMLPVQIPQDAKNLKPFETNRRHLVDGAIQGFKALYLAMGATTPEVLEIITPKNYVSDI
jgi:predicted patatin/cPLA2 family phospholipase